MNAPAAADEVWTVGQAASYLNAGPVNLRFSPRRVRRAAQDPTCQIRVVAGGTGGGRRRWFRLLASTVRAERARLLAASGFEDPDWPADRSSG